MTPIRLCEFIALKIGSAAAAFDFDGIDHHRWVLPAAEPLYRESQPRQIAVEQAFNSAGCARRNFFSAAVGAFVCGAHIGYVVAFTCSDALRRMGATGVELRGIGEHRVSVGFRAPAIGLLASTNEESLSACSRFPFREVYESRWIAVIVPAFLWGFLHSNYPQEPAYIRGSRSDIGSCAGLVMLRWGNTGDADLALHVDASLVGLFLVRSNSLYFKILGAVIARRRWHRGFSGISYLIARRFEPDEDL